MRLTGEVLIAFFGCLIVAYAAVKSPFKNQGYPILFGNVFRHTIPGLQPGIFLPQQRG